MGWLVVIIIVIVIAVAAAQAANAAEEAKRKAKQAYQRALSHLKQDPVNANLRQKTLSLGRAYSDLMRDKKGNTVFDEVALMNDINAACAAAHQVVPKQQAVQSESPIEDRLRKLHALREKGLIDDEDFAQRKREIIDGI